MIERHEFVHMKLLVSCDGGVNVIPNNVIRFSLFPSMGTKVGELTQLPTI
jgi:hypothetical protein